MSISSGRAGDIAETVASAYLMHKGYEVFCNQSSKGPIDLVAIDAEGNTHLYDVKRCNINSGRVYPTTSQSPSSKRLADTLGVRLLHVFISDSFQIIVEEDEDLLLEKVKGLGYKVRGQDITSSSWTYLYHLCKDGTRKESVKSIYGIEDITGLRRHEVVTKLIRNGLQVDGWVLEGKEKVSR